MTAEGYGYYCACGYYGTQAEVIAHRAESTDEACKPYDFGDRPPAKSSSSVTTFTSTKDKGRSV